MKHENEDRSLDLIELGTASEDTRGNDLYAIEGVGFMPKHGISNE
jgi:hypothetical protein